MHQKQHIQKSQFLTKIALAFLVFLGCFITPNIIQASLIGNFTEGAKIAVTEVIPGISAAFSQASLASFWQGVTCFFGINCSTVATQSPNTNNQASNNNQSSNDQIKNDQPSVIAGKSQEKNHEVIPSKDANVQNLMVNDQSPAQIIQNINPTKEIQTKEIQTIHTNTITEHTNTVVVDEDTKNKVNLLLRQLDSDRPNYSVGQTYTLPANLLGSTLNIGAGNFTISASGDANAQNLTTEHGLTVRGNFSVTGAQTYTGAGNFTSSNASSTLTTTNTGTGFALQADNLTLKTNTLNTATGNLILNSNTGLIEIAASGVKFTNAIPSDTTMALYNDSGTLKWNGAALAMGSSVSGTIGYLPKFTASNALGNSVLFESAGKVGIGTTTPDYALEINGTIGSSNDLYFAGANKGIYFAGDSAGTHFSNKLLSFSGSTFTVGGGAGNYVNNLLLKGGNSGLTLNTGSGAGTTRLAVDLSGNFNFNGGQIYLQQNSGNVGIGTTAPENKLEVYQNSASVIDLLRLYNPNDSVGAGSGIAFDAGSGGSQFARIVGGYNATTQRYLAFSTNSEIMRITSGNVGIGTATPFYKLDVNGTFNSSATSTFATRVGIGTTSPANLLTINHATAPLLEFDNDGTILSMLGSADDAISGGGVTDFGIRATNNLLFSAGGTTERMRILSSGNVGIGTTAPVSALNVSGTTGITWGGGTFNSTFGLATIGSAGTGASLFVNTPSFSNYWSSGLAIDGNYNSNISTINIKALGVDNSSYSSNLTFNTTNGTVLSEIMRIQGSSGNIGIGTTVPTHKLNVVGDVQIGDAFNYTPNTALDLVVGSATENSRFLFGQSNIYYGGLQWNYNATSTNAFLSVGTMNGSIASGINILQSGNVGIGTTSPGVLLDVNGTVRSPSFNVGTVAGLSYFLLDVNGLHAGSFGRDQITNGAITAGGAYPWRIISGSGGYAGGYITLETDNSERVRIDSSGNVGIGVTAPSAELEITEAASSTWVGSFGGLKLSGNVNHLLFANSARATKWYQYLSGNDLRFYDTAVRLTIQNGGNVGIGTPAPTSKLTVRGDSSGAVTDLLRLENLGTAAVNSGMGLQFIANRTAGGATEFGRIDSLITNIDNTYYSGALRFKIASNGTLETLMEVGNPNIVMNRPLEVNVAGDVGIDYDLQFTSAAGSYITSAGPLSITAGSPNVYDNLILSLAGDSSSNGGDIIADIRYSNTTFGGFKVSGADNGSFVFRVDPNGNVGIGGNGNGAGNLMVKQNLALTGGNIIVQKLSMPTNLTCVPQGTAGTSTYRFQITALNDNGETTASTLCETTTGNATLDATNYVLLAWDPVSGATKYRIYGCSGAACTPTLDNDAEPHASSPTNTYNVDDSSFGATALPATNTTGGNLAINRTSASYALDVLATGTNIARFNGTNNTGCTLSDGGIIACSSDERLKKNIENTVFGINDIMKLRPVSFNWTTDNDNASSSIGFIAQEVEGILPHLVMTDANGYKELNTIGLVPVLVKAVQEQQLQIEELQLAGGLIGATSTGALVNSGGISQTLKNMLASVGMVFENSIVKVREFAADIFSAKQANIEQIKAVRQIEMIDTATGQLYCTQITNGEWIKNPGACSTTGDSAPAPQASATETPTEQPSQPPSENNSTTTEEIAPPENYESPTIETPDPENSTTTHS